MARLRGYVQFNKYTHTHTLTSGPTACGDFCCDCMFWEKRGGLLLGHPVGPQVDTATIRTILGTNRVNSRSFSSRCWAFRGGGERRGEEGEGRRG